MTIDDFIRECETRKLRFRVWCLEPGHPRLIRSCLVGTHCPLTSLALRMGHGIFHSSRAHDAAAALGLSKTDAYMIIKAADDRAQESWVGTDELRATMLTWCDEPPLARQAC